MARITILTAALVLLFMHVMPAAGETTTAKTTEAQWALANKCNRNAIAKYPDYTSEAAAKRERDVRQCLLANRLPARGPLTSQPLPPK
jgi:hypothetical protein